MLFSGTNKQLGTTLLKYLIIKISGLSEVRLRNSAVLYSCLWSTQSCCSS